MSKTKISMKSRRELWFRAAGRCEFKGCNEPLDRHGCFEHKSDPILACGGQNFSGHSNKPVFKEIGRASCRERV